VIRLEEAEMAKTLLDAIYGSLIAGAIGDALGAPVEGWYWTEIRETYGHVTELMPSDRANTGINYGGRGPPRQGRVGHG
jgi:ADP-ribosylglycohydrolase